MSEPTEADIQRADAICTDMPGVDFDDNGESWREKVRYVAVALAEERARARAPFLAEAAKLDQRAAAMYDDKRAEGEITTNEEELLADAFHHCADRIRRAAEPSS